MANERLNEALVRDHFKDDVLFGSIKFEEQKSSNKKVSELLKRKSKAGGSGAGYPEFILTFPTDSKYLIVVECKALNSMHESKHLDKPKDFAVDGVLHYAEALSKEFEVIAIATSGESEKELRVSHFLWRLGAKKYERLADKKLLSLNDYLKIFANERFAENLRSVDIISKAIYLNEEYNNFSIPELTRNTMVSAILLSLLDKPFRDSYSSQRTIKSLGEAMMGAIKTTLSENSVRNENAMIGEYSKLLNEPIFRENAVKNKKTKKLVYSLEVMKEIIDYLHKNVYPLTQMDDSGFDVLGRFYTEFIRYAGSEQKQGLVLTPSHVTDLFCDLTEINSNDIVYDPCCGTAGFLIAGMKRLFKLAGNDKKKHTKIRTTQLVGVEIRPQMYTYACSNMMLRGDGRSNIYCGDCYQTKGAILKHKPTVAFLNPPYDVGTAQQMEFIEHAIDVVKPQQGRVAAIVQMSCGIKDEKDLIEVKKRILEKAHLKAVLSMPDDLFYPVGVVTCVMVFDTSKENAGHKSWFGYFKDDGFEKRKNQGRIDARGRFAAIRKKWLDAYKNIDEVPGLSVRHEVFAEDEWCAEAYMETDYQHLNDNDFICELRDYVSFLISFSNPYVDFFFSNKPLQTKKRDASFDKWKWFKLGDWFDKPYKAKAYNAIDLTEESRDSQDSIAYITRTDLNNGCKSYVQNENFEHIEIGNAITVGDTTATIFYQEREFICGDHMVVLRSEHLNKYVGLFITTLLNKERFRYNYGRAFNKDVIANTLLKLPAIKTANGKYEPDWQFMEDYIKSLPYSSCL